MIYDRFAFVTLAALTFCAHTVSAASDLRDLSIVVMLHVTDGQEEDIGAGIVFFQNGQRTYIATARHVVALAGRAHGKVTAEFRSKIGERLGARIVPLGMNRKVEMDLAVLEVENAPAIASFEVLLPERFHLGTQAYLVGYMNGQKWARGQPEPLVESSPEELRIDSRFVASGASGGGAFDPEGALIGMVTRDNPPYASAVPIDSILRIIREEWSLPVSVRANESLASPEALRALSDRGMPPDVQTVKRALMSLDTRTLGLLLDSRVAPSVVEEAMRQPAEDAYNPAILRFFENSKHSPQAMSWFKSVLRYGLNPNMLVPHPYYRREALLVLALRAGNVEAMKALLEAGASPHGYQDLLLTGGAGAKFVFPLEWVADDNRLTLAEKQDLARAFLRAGTIVPPVLPPRNGIWAFGMLEAQRVQEKAGSEIGMTLPISKNICEQASTLCRQDSRNSETCRLIATMPKKGTLIQDGVSYGPMALQYLLAVTDDNIYFLALTEQILPAFRDPISVDYSVVEVTKDGRTWNVLRYMAPEGGMDQCKWIEGITPKYDYCWSSIHVQLAPLNRDQQTVADCALPLR